jgi:hypothetical protein
MLIYVKASMNGSEDTSVLQYHASHNAFPHESTGDQFYGEDQFESYRRLGREIAFEAFGSVSEAPDLVAAVATLLAGAHVELGERAKSPGDQRGRVPRNAE